jgi:hypothetical protein
MRVRADEFTALDLEVHRVLAGVPLKDVSAVDLPGGGPDRTLADVRAIMEHGALRGANPAVRALVDLRLWIGKQLGWDGEEHESRRHAPASWGERVPPALAARSSVPPGTREGNFRVLYVLARESLAEIRNATVHAALAMALVPQPSGYRLYWGVYVQPVTRWTPVYMAAIEPFRRFIVYPSVLGKLRSVWTQRYASGARAA